MRIGIFSATYLDLKLDEVLKMASGLGYSAVELPAFTDNPHLDIEKAIRDSAYAKSIKELVNKNGMIISALANHPEGQIVLGPYGKDTDAIFKGTRKRRSNLALSA